MADREESKHIDAVKTLERLGYDYYDIGGHTDWYLDRPEEATPPADAALADVEYLDLYLASNGHHKDGTRRLALSRIAAALRARAFLAKIDAVPPGEPDCASRESAVALINHQFNRGFPKPAGTAFHYGKQELRQLLDLIYGSKPTKESEEIK